MKSRRGAALARVAAILAVRPQRPIVLSLAAAAMGLAVAAVGVFHPAPREMLSVPPGDVALVNQEPILMSDFMDDTQSATGVSFEEATAAQRAQVLHDMIDKELLVQRSLALNLPEEDTQVRDALADGVNNQIASGILATPPTEDALRAYFAAHRANYASQGVMNLTDLVLHYGGFEDADQSLQQAMADAAEAVYELRSGKPMDAVVQHLSMANSGKVNGDEIDFAAKLHLGPKLYAAALALSDGEISEPVADADGVHVLVMQRRVAPVVADFDKVRNNVYADYINEIKGQSQQENLKFLRKNAQILLASGQTQ